MSADTDWKDVSAGYSYSLALKEDNTLYTWGYNISYELGLGDRTNRDKPEKVKSDTNRLTIAAGYFASLALKNDSTLYAWGINNARPVKVGTEMTGKLSDQVDPTFLPSKPTAGSTHGDLGNISESVLKNYRYSMPPHR